VGLWSLISAAESGDALSARRIIMTKIFGAESTTDEVLEGVDLTGKRILVTGVSAGLGVETARTLAAHGAWVVGAVRDLGKGPGRDKRGPRPGRRRRGAGAC
jgi:hypothetical protein